MPLVLSSPTDYRRTRARKTRNGDQGEGRLKRHTRRRRLSPNGVKTSASVRNAAGISSLPKYRTFGTTADSLFSVTYAGYQAAFLYPHSIKYEGDTMATAT